MIIACLKGIAIVDLLIEYYTLSLLLTEPIYPFIIKLRHGYYTLTRLTRTVSQFKLTVTTPRLWSAKGP